MIKGWNTNDEKRVVRKAALKTFCSVVVLLVLACAGVRVQIISASTLGTEGWGELFASKTIEPTKSPVETSTEVQSEEESSVEESTVPTDADEFIFWDSNIRYLTEEEVRGCSADELAKARNELYARRGRIFVGGKWEEYFNSKSWYQGTIPADSFKEDSIFNDFEMKNLYLIVKIEKEK